MPILMSSELRSKSTSSRTKKSDAEDNILFYLSTAISESLSPAMSLDPALYYARHAGEETLIRSGLQGLASSSRQELSSGIFDL